MVGNYAITFVMKSSRQHLDADIIIAGAGLAGLTLALALAPQNFRVLILDEKPWQDHIRPDYDARTTAIAAAAMRMLDAYGVGKNLRRSGSPIHRIRVTNGEATVPLDFDYREVGGEAFGWIIENHVLRRALVKGLEASQSVSFKTPYKLEAIKQGPASITIDTKQGPQFTARLLIAADGRRSHCRTLAGIRVREKPYWQSALVTTITHQKPHQQIALEHFLPGGPLAILPMAGNRSSLVWSDRHAVAQHMAAMSDAEFRAELSQRLEGWLGKITAISRRVVYPLTRLHAASYAAPRLALMGEAAHAIHPIAGQGYNLSMRDIVVLVEELARARKLGLDIGSLTTLLQYDRRRRADNMNMILATDGLDHLFAITNPAIDTMRNLGFGVVRGVLPLKKFFMETAMGRHAMRA
jgi:2-octaprenyl-6-methoxyphenol hydroxylase